MNPLGPVASKPAKRPMKATLNITHLRLEPDRNESLFVQISAQMDIASYIMHLFGLFTLQLVPLLDEEGGKSQHYKLLKKRKIRSLFFTCKLNLLWQHVCVGHVVPTPNNKKNPKLASSTSCGQDQCWPVINFWTHPMDIKRAHSKEIFKKGYVFQKAIQLTTLVGYTFIIYNKNYQL